MRVPPVLRRRPLSLLLPRLLSLRWPCARLQVELSFLPESMLLLVPPLQALLPPGPLRLRRPPELPGRVPRVLELQAWCRPLLLLPPRPLSPHLPCVRLRGGPSSLPASALFSALQTCMNVLLKRRSVTSQNNTTKHSTHLARRAGFSLPSLRSSHEQENSSHCLVSVNQKCRVRYRKSFLSVPESVTQRCAHGLSPSLTETTAPSPDTIPADPIP